ncbi:hypothetical protein T190607A01A_30241 [Tenacibaculum sp. 190524A05c]|uniref:Uncharacterized protein n=1 Tax=Tenacibaculum platacis TaxID=3137852 RepID=A0ABP1EVI1_9FLAO
MRRLNFKLLSLIYMINYSLKLFWYEKIYSWNNPNGIVFRLFEWSRVQCRVRY